MKMSSESQYRAFVMMTRGQRTAAPSWEDSPGTPARELLDFADAHPPTNDWDARVIASFGDVSFYDFTAARDFVYATARLAHRCEMEVRIAHSFIEPENHPIIRINLVLFDEKPERRTHGR